MIGDSFTERTCSCSAKRIAIAKYVKVANLIRELNVSDGIYTLSEYGKIEVEDGVIKKINNISLEMMPLRPSQEASDLVRKLFMKHFDKLLENQNHDK